MCIERNQERIKQTGEVFTPTVLVIETLDKLPKTIWADENEPFCDPTCGDGEFLVEVLKRRIKAGMNLNKAASLTFGVDLMPDNVALCKKRLRTVLADAMEAEGRGRKLNGGVNDSINNNIVCHDALTWDFDNWRPEPKQLKLVPDTSLISM